MRTLREVSEAFLQRFEKVKMTKQELKDRAGVTYKTLSHVLSGTEDFKMSTAMAIADRLGLEFVLVPKEASGLFAPSRVTPQVLTKVQEAVINRRSVETRKTAQVTEFMRPLELRSAEPKNDSMESNSKKGS